MDNVYTNLPAKVEDGGRDFGDYRSSRALNEHIKHINNIWRDDDYRLFLQKNGKKYMDKDWERYNEQKKYWINACVHNYPTRITNNQMAEEMKKYNMMSNSTIPQDVRFKNSQCKKYNDYRFD